MTGYLTLQIQVELAMHSTDRSSTPYGLCLTVIRTLSAPMLSLLQCHLRLA